VGEEGEGEVQYERTEVEEEAVELMQQEVALAEK
jgi:hypothetical protein